MAASKYAYPSQQCQNPETLFIGWEISVRLFYTWFYHNPESAVTRQSGDVAPPRLPWVCRVSAYRHSANTLP
jgi:hypothetical protein